MTYNVFCGSLSLTQSINQSIKDPSKFHLCIELCLVVAEMHRRLRCCPSGLCDARRKRLAGGLCCAGGGPIVDVDALSSTMSQSRSRHLIRCARRSSPDGRGRTYQAGAP